MWCKQKKEALVWKCLKKIRTSRCSVMSQNHKVSMWQQCQWLECLEVRFHSQWCRRWWLRWGPRWRWCSCVWRTALPGCRRSAAPACERQSARQEHTLCAAWVKTTLVLLLCIHVQSGFFLLDTSCIHNFCRKTVIKLLCFDMVKYHSGLTLLPEFKAESTHR